MTELAINWPAVGVLTTILIGLVTAIVRNATRLTTAEAAAEAAKKSASSSLARVIEMEKALTNHRVEVAEKYVSKDTHEASEGRILAAITRLGDRIDEMLRHGRST